MKKNFKLIILIFNKKLYAFYDIQYVEKLKIKIRNKIKVFIIM